MKRLSQLERTAYGPIRPVTYNEWFGRASRGRLYVGTPRDPLVPYVYANRADERRAKAALGVKP